MLSYLTVRVAKKKTLDGGEREKNKKTQSNKQTKKLLKKDYWKKKKVIKKKKTAIKAEKKKKQIEYASFSKKTIFSPLQTLLSGEHFQWEYFIDTANMFFA